MAWLVEFHPDFRLDFDALSEAVQDEIVATARLLADAGPALKRPHADTLKGSRYANMKELRFEADRGEWRLAYAFDPARQGILLVAGDKSGVSEKRFYRALIRKADERFDSHLSSIGRKGKRK